MKTTPVIDPPRVFEKDTSHLPDAWFVEKPSPFYHSNKVIQACWTEQNKENDKWVRPRSPI